MDKPAIKTVLSAYRAGRPGEEDPVFAEALREVGKDPELARWFAEEQRFDARMAETFRAMPTPARLKESILLHAKSAGARPFTGTPTTRGWQGRVVPSLALAAVFVLAFVLGRLTLPHAPPPTVAANGGGGNRLASQAIAYTGRMPALQFVCFDASEVARWVDNKSAAMRMGKVLEKPMASMQMIGSSTADWDGKPVVMVALQNGRQMAMLYFVRAADFPDAAGATDEIMEKDGYATRTSHSGNCLYVLTTKGTRADLKFPMPL